jgi:hypothetical protein
MKGNKSSQPPSNPSDDELDEDDKKKLAAIEAELALTKKIQAENAQKIIDRGPRLENLVAETGELQKQTEEFKDDAKKLERVEEIKNHHLLSILFGMGGFALGALYAFFVGYSLPMMLVFGALGGTLLYGLSTIVTGFRDKVVAVEDAFHPLSWMHLAFAGKESTRPSNEKENRQLSEDIAQTYQRFSPQFDNDRQQDKKMLPEEFDEPQVVKSKAYVRYSPLK